MQNNNKHAIKNFNVSRAIENRKIRLNYLLIQLIKLFINPINLLIRFGLYLK